MFVIDASLLELVLGSHFTVAPRTFIFIRRVWLIARTCSIRPEGADDAQNTATNCANGIPRVADAKTRDFIVSWEYVFVASDYDAHTGATANTAALACCFMT